MGIVNWAGFIKQNRIKSRFYQEATFYTTEQITDLLGKAGFSDFKIKQIMVLNNQETVQVVENGFERGSFVVIKASRQ